MTVETELKPCPFCGATSNDFHLQATPTHNLGGNVSGYTVECDECAGFGPHKQTQDEAHAAWNTRAALAGSSAKVEEALEAITRIHQARLHNGRDEGWGWDIGMLNRAMDLALPLIGQPRPERMSHEERTAMRARFDALLDADRAALSPQVTP